MDDKNRTVSAGGNRNSPENASAGSGRKTQVGVDASVLSAISQTEARRRAISGTDPRTRVTPARGAAAPAASSASPDGRVPEKDASARPGSRAPAARTPADRTGHAAPQEKGSGRGNSDPARISPEMLRAQRENEKKAEEAAFRERLRKEEEAKAAAAAEKRARNERLAKEKAAERAAKEAEKERLRRIREEKTDLARAAARERAERIREKLAFALRVCRRYAGRFFAYLLIILLLVSAVVAASFVTFLKADTAGMTKTIVYTVGSSRNRKQKAKELVYGGVIYTDITGIAKLCGLSVTGDSKQIRFTSPNGEYAVFSADDRTADVNGTRVIMEGPARLGKQTVSVPLSFVRTYMTGVDVEFTYGEIEETGDGGSDGGSGQRLITGITISAVKDADGLPVTPGFLLKPAGTLERVDKDSLPTGWLLLGDDNIVYTYKTDLSSYQKYMNPQDRNAYILVINSANRDDGSFVPSDMTAVLNARSGRSLQMERNAEKSLEALFVEMHAEGFDDVFAGRAYVSYKTQSDSFGNALFTERYYYSYNYSVNGKYFSDAAYSVLGKAYLESTYINLGKTVLTISDGTRVATSYCPEGGTSDHQTGLAADLWGSGGEKAFGSTEAYRWLRDNAYKFGFVERFPQGKEKITGRAAEPCHWRFVGQYHAAVMQEYGFCLEEYVAYITDGRS